MEKYGKTMIYTYLYFHNFISCETLPSPIPIDFYHSKKIACLAVPEYDVARLLCSNLFLTHMKLVRKGNLYEESAEEYLWQILYIPIEW